MKPSMEKLVKSELPDADYPDFDPGDTIRVTTREEIGGTMRTRKFEGVCIARKGDGPNQTFKVRKVSFGVGVERIFPLYSPIIEEIEVIRRGKVRRAKLNYLEGLSTKKARIKERDYRPEVEDQLDTETVPDEPIDEEMQEAEPTSEPETASESDAGDEDEQAHDGEETGEETKPETD